MTLPALVVVHGEEELLATRAVDAVIARARTEDPEVTVTSIEAAEASVATVVGAFAPGLFGGHSLLVVTGAGDLPQDVAELVEQWTSAPEPDCTLVVRYSPGVKGKALREKLLKRADEVVACPKITKPAERKDFVHAEFRAAGRRIDTDAIDALVVAVGSDLRELASAAEQLIADVDGTIDAQAVARYYTGKAETTGFEAADAIVAGGREEAVAVLRQCALVGVAPVLVTSAVAANMRAIGRVLSAPGGPPGPIAAALGMPPWKVDRVRRWAQAWTPQSVTISMIAIAHADAEVKGAGADAQYALERMLDALQTARDGGRGRRRGRSS